MRGRSWVEVLGIARAAEAGKDLPPLREIPVAKGAPGNERVGHPGAAAQHSVLIPEEGFGVLRVGEGGEAGIAVEERRRPLPDAAGHMLELVANCRRGLLP